MRSHIASALGRMKLEALRKAHLDRLYADLLRAKPEGAGLAPSSVRRVHADLYATMEEVVRGDLIPRRSREQAEGSPGGGRAARCQAGRGAPGGPAKGDKYECLYVLSLTCGLRMGEALGLKWSDIDLDKGTLRVNRQLQRMRRDADRSGTLEFSELKNASRPPDLRAEVFGTRVGATHPRPLLLLDAEHGP